MADKSILSSELRAKIATALKAVRKNIQWKPGKGHEHLQTRKRYGHLAPNAALEEYNEIIQSLVNSETAELYVYIWREEVFYPTVVSTYEQKIWLVMFSLSGILETAFPPTNLEEYLSDERFHYQGSLQEFLDE
jgi:hypothetical protein